MIEDQGNMSHPPLSGYSSYYGTSSSNQQSGQQQYGSSRQSGTSSYGQQYQHEDSQTQYQQPSGYDWSSQGQSNPPPSSQAYDSWREASGQRSQYDYGREASNYATQAAAGNTQSYSTHYGSSNTPATSSMSGLNNLAYASGLDNQR